MKENIFREYDIRGIVGPDLVLESVYDLGRAIVTFLKRRNPTMQTIIVGRDGRSHSPQITQDLIKSILDSGINVIDVGLIPTPTLYFAVKTLKNPYGLMVTASHNPGEYNGIKCWDTSGKDFQEIRRLFEAQDFESLPPQQGVLSTHNIKTDYVEYLGNAFAHLKGSTLNAVIDCGNGAAGSVLPELLAKLEFKNVAVLCGEVDGNFPNHQADPTAPENMVHVKEFLAKNKNFTVGLGFDGDCDRMNPMTQDGTLVPGDQLLSLFAQSAVKANPGRAVVFDIKSSGGLVELLVKWGAIPIMAPSGHTHIKHSMRDNNAILAGELSCHFFFNDRYFGYDDGIYAALRLFEMLHLENKQLDELLEIFPKKISSREFRLECRSEKEKSIIVDHVKQCFAARKDVESNLIDGIRVTTPYGWGLVRASNTQPVICLRFESENATDLNRVKQDFYEALQPYFDTATLKEYIELI